MTPVDQAEDVVRKLFLLGELEPPPRDSRSLGQGKSALVESPN